MHFVPLSALGLCGGYVFLLHISHEEKGELHLWEIELLEQSHSQHPRVEVQRHARVFDPEHLSNWRQRLRF